LAPSFAGSAANTTYLESTLTVLKHKLETGIEVVRDDDRSLPELPAYAGRLGALAWRLDICWRTVVQRHHGDQRLTSTPGDTRFQVLLPLTQNR
jgi:hypothetical protein